MGRLGKKRADRRWEDSNGDVWASRFEYLVFRALRALLGGRVRRNFGEDSHTFSYTSNLPRARCLECNGRSIVQDRTYTPDIRVHETRDPSSPVLYYIEAKGYFAQQKRSLLRSFLQTGPDIDLRVILERDGKATRTLTIGGYIDKYMKIPWHVFKYKLKVPGPVIPEEWK